MHFSEEAFGLAGQLLEAALVDVVHVVAAGGQGDVEVVGIGRLGGCGVAGVEQLEVSGAGGVVADVIQHADELRVALAIHLLQFDRYQFYLAEYTGREEIGRGVEAVQDVALVSLHHRLQLEDIAHEQQLLAAEGFAQVMAIDAQDAVDGVDDVGPHHRNFVDDDQLQLLEQLAVGFGVLEELVDASLL